MTWLTSISTWAIGKPKTALVASTVAFLCAGIGLAQLQIESDYRIYFDSESSTLLEYEEFKETYSRDDNIMIGFEPKSGAATSDGAQQLNKLLTAAAWKLPYVTRVDSIANFQKVVGEGDTVTIADLLPEDQLVAESELASYLQSEPDLLGRLISTDLKLTVIVASLDFTIPYNQAIPEATNAARALVAKLKTDHPGFDFYLTGGVPLNNAFAEASLADMMGLIPVMYAVITLMIFFLLRSVIATVSVLLLVGLASAVGMSTLGFFGIPLSPPSTAASIIIMTIAIADAVHLYTVFNRKLLEGLEKAAALKASLEHLLMPILITSITTAIGFFALNSADSPPFRHMGNAAAIGTIAALFGTLWTLPALIMLLPMKAARPAQLNRVPFDRLGRFVVGNRILVASMAILATASAIYGIANLKIDANAFRYFDESYQFRVDTDYVVGKLGGLERLEFSFESGEEGGIFEPAYLHAMERIVEFAQQDDRVAFVASPLGIFKRVGQAMDGGSNEAYKLPDNYDMAAQNFLFYELSLPFGQDLTSQINIDKSASRITVGLGDISTNDQIEIGNNIANFAKTQNRSGTLSGPTGISPMFARITQANIWSNIEGGALAYFIITFIIGLALKSWVLGLVSILPNLLPSILAIGLWAAFNDTIGLPGTVIFTLTIGIIVDDTIHMLAAYRNQPAGLAPSERVQKAMLAVAPAMTSTSLILCAGFAVLAQSSFTGNSHVGIMAALCVAMALATDLLLLPIVLAGKSTK